MKKVFGGSTDIDRQVQPIAPAGGFILASIGVASYGVLEHNGILDIIRELISK